MNINDLINKRVLVAGLGLTGLSVVNFLERHGVDFDIADERDVEQSIPGLSKHYQRHDSFTPELLCRFDIIVLSPGIPRAHPAVTAALHAGVDVIGDIELFADAVDVPVIAVTGSNGKSTVVAWLADVINDSGIKAVACGNIGEPALDALLSDAHVLVLELSSYQLESTRSLQPLVATVLNVSEDHLDRYDDIDHYAATKRQIYKGAKHCLANHDDTRTWPELKQETDCEFFSIESTGNSSIRWQSKDVAALALRVPGEHNKANALVVLALASILDLGYEKCTRALVRFTGLPHRSQFIAEENGVRWYNDSKGTNVDACKKAVLAMPGPVILIAGGLGKGADFSALRAPVSQCVKLLLLMGEDRQLIAEELDGCASIRMVDSMHAAVSTAQQQAVPGDSVLLSPACASFDMFRNFEDRGEQFVAAVQEVLAA